MCKYINKNGICEISGIPCEKVVLCSEDGVWIDKKDEDFKEKFMEAKNE